MFDIEISDRQEWLNVQPNRVEEAVRNVLREENIVRASISVAIVDDETIHELNRRYLGHDYATDVLSFASSAGPEMLDGDIMVSAETAFRTARKYNWSAHDELILYVMHGTLHLVGYDDQDDCSITRMQERETHYLKLMGITAWNDDVRGQRQLKGAKIT